MAPKGLLDALRLRWPPRYVIASIICSFGGFVMGIDMGIIGPVTVMKAYIDQFGELPATVHGIIVSCLLISASVSSFIAGRPADVLGRPQAIALGAGVVGLGAALQAGAVSLAMFIVGRVIEGLGYGSFFGTLTVYICEISPPSVRGPLTTGPQFLICLGLVVGFFTCYGTDDIGSSLSWRLPFVLLAAISIIYTTACLTVLPPSPRWLILNGRSAEAITVYETLNIKQESRQKVEDVIGEEMFGEKDLSDQDSSEASTWGPKREKHASSFLDIFSSDMRGRTILAVFLMGMLQLSGIDAVLYYAPLLFQQAGLKSSSASFFASGVSGIVLFVVSIPALLFADKWGRRTSTIIGGLGLTATMLLMGSLYAGHAVHSDRGVARWVVIVCIYLYAIFFATSWAVSIKVYAPEIQPQRTRAQTTSLAHGVNWVCNFFVAFICPILLARSSSAAYFLFGGFTAVTTIACFLFMIETKGKSLEEIEEAFKMKRGNKNEGVVQKAARAFGLVIFTRVD